MEAKGSIDPIQPIFAQGHNIIEDAFSPNFNNISH